MSTPPPPPPFSSASPTERRWYRQALREQRRAAALVAQQQRAAYRAQTHAMRRRSSLGPLLLVALGLGFLFLEAGALTWDGLLHGLDRWWPLLLVLSGTILLAEWAIDRWVGAGDTAGIPRRTVGIGGGFLLLLLVAVGIAGNLVDHTGWQQRDLFGDASGVWGLGQLFAHHNDTVHDLSEAFPSGGLLTIRNDRGSITLSGTSEDNLVHVSAHQRLWAWQRRDLSRLQTRVRPTLQTDGNGLLLTVNDSAQAETDLTIELPHEAALTIGADRGQITISELRGPLTIQDHVGGIELTALTGHVRITADDNTSTISGHSLSGDVLVEGRTGDLNFSDVTGPLTLHGDFYGATQLERVSGAVNFQSNYTKLTAAAVPGNLQISGRTELEGRDLSGPITLTTSERNVTIEHIRGAGTVTDRNGSITLSLAAPLGPLSVSTSNGAIQLAVPPRAAFHVDAATANSKITNDFGLKFNERGNQVSLVGQVHAGGPALQLRTTLGDIDIRKVDSSVMATQDVPASDDDDTEL